MSAILALLSSLMFGASDYIGGHLAKKHNVMAVVGMSQIIGLSVGVVLLFMSGTWVAPTFSWSGYFLPGLVAGLIGFVGLNTFFAGLATGRMGVVSPIASLSVMVPVLYSMAQGERPSMVAIAGMVIAILGAFFGSGPEIKGGVSFKPLILAVITAICFGASVLFLTIGSQSSVLLTAVTMRIPNLFIMAFLALRFRTLGEFGRRSFMILVVGGTFDFLANLCIGQASTMGLVSTAVVLASLYPVVTTMMAFKFSHERLHKVQYIGAILAVTGISLISFG